METKNKLGQSPAYGNIGKSRDREYPGMTERRKIASDVLCALIASGTNSIYLHKDDPEFDELISKRALSITDTFLKLESE